MSTPKSGVQKPKKRIQKAKETASFPPLNPLVAACVSTVNHKVVARKSKLITLQRRLLQAGGHMVFFCKAEQRADALIEYGRLFTTKGLQVRSIDYYGDYRDVALLCAESSNDILLCFGYALNPNGLWVQHYWGYEPWRLDDGQIAFGQIIEPTKQRLAYFGVGYDSDWTALLVADIAPELRGVRRGNLIPGFDPGAKPIREEPCLRLWTRTH